MCKPLKPADFRGLFVESTAASFSCDLFPSPVTYSLNDRITIDTLHHIAPEADSRQRVDRSSQEKEHFLSLLLPLRDRLARFARSVTNDPEEAQDLVGDTILAALEGFSRVRSEKAFLGYLFTIAVRINRRKRWRRRLFDRFDESAGENIADANGSTDSAADVDLLRRALVRLPERQREAVVLFEITGLSLEEIREIQGGSISGVKSRVSRGRQELARLLGAVDRPVERESTRNGAVSPTGTSSTPYLVYTKSQSHG